MEINSNWFSRYIKTKIYKYKKCGCNCEMHVYTCTCVCMYIYYICILQVCVEADVHGIMI